MKDPTDIGYSWPEKGGVADEGGESSDEDSGASRRHVLRGVGLAGVGLGLGGFATHRQETFRLGGEVQAWRGRAPSSIAGQANPTLSLQAGTQYAVTWENLDGLPHNFVIQNEAGEQMVRSEIITQQGAMQTVTFTASPEMATYLCEVHPNTMVGDVNVSGSGGNQTTTQATTTTTQQQDSAGYFEQGPEVGVQVVAQGMTAPTDHAIAGDGSGRQFVTDQTGEVWVVTENGREQMPFIDISDRMVTLGEFNGSYANPTQAYDERGLLGIEFHPSFAENRKFYLHYSAPPNNQTPDGWDHVEVVSEFTASSDLTTGNPESERILLQFQKPQYNHDGGPIAFGPDGYLYVPMGDGGGANDDMYGHVPDWYDRNAGGNGQDVTENLLGDVVRIDVDATEGDRPYGIPDDNPFVGTDGLDEIYAYGFRNPYGISFDSEGNLFVADAGQNLFEEVDVVERGGNYGWNVKEGTHCFSTEDPSDPMAITDCPSNEPNSGPYDGSPLIDPVIEFPHTYQGESVGITVIGGHRYEATTIPELEGKYVFGIWTSDPARNEPNGRVLAATPPENFGGAGGTTTGNADLWPVQELAIQGGFDYFVRMFGQGSNGDVYVLANKRGAPEGDTGVLLQLVPPGDGGTTTTTGNATTTGTDGGTTTSETTTGGGDAETTSTSGPGPGFLLSAVAVLGGIGLAAKRRLQDDD
ncbi:PQQ-dependent sugar dehydrogenase [Halorarius litoreus]|uniref:PQQ-dependent sugar dehydrogenase n=1 Tax=Halorarius litoreus TaxID=2962676 RepID=UPI0020CC1536|nr:PQQ-dependent sugar dehydrogenase [Halorarius litoreus]